MVKTFLLAFRNNFLAAAFALPRLPLHQSLEDIVSQEAILFRLIVKWDARVDLIFRPYRRNLTRAPSALSVFTGILSGGGYDSEVGAMMLTGVLSVDGPFSKVSVAMSTGSLCGAEAFLEVIFGEELS